MKFKVGTLNLIRKTGIIPTLRFHHATYNRDAYDGCDTQQDDYALQWCHELALPFYRMLPESMAAWRQMTVPPQGRNAELSQSFTGWV